MGQMIRQGISGMIRQGIDDNGTDDQAGDRDARRCLADLLKQGIDGHKCLPGACVHTVGGDIKLITLQDWQPARTRTEEGAGLVRLGNTTEGAEVGGHQGLVTQQKGLI